ncbi:MAG: hypothetical protein LBQ87_02655 [Candidatus Fibromonas sp.]|nr:hypothetical protein [Candidatus Fibromonas sp.]
MVKKGVLFLVSAVLLWGCKGKNESDGDSYYKDGKFRNAVNSYTAAMQKGKISDGFYDSFVIAYASAAKQTAKKNASDDIILSYVEQIHKNLPKTKKTATLDSVVQALSEIGVGQVEGDYDYEYTLQGFRNLDSAISIAKRGGISAGGAEAARKKAENAIVKQAIENANGAENDISAEYTLLEAEVVAPNNPDLKKALDVIRVKNRGIWLIFAETIIGKRPSRMVDKYGYGLALPILNISPTGITGEVSIWNSIGNNVTFSPNKIKLVSKTGDSTFAKYTGGGWCSIDKVVNGVFTPTNVPFKGSEGELRTEKTCNARFSFSYKKDFVPDYVEYKDSDNNIGRKYFGQK